MDLSNYLSITFMQFQHTSQKTLPLPPFVPNNAIMWTSPSMETQLTSASIHEGVMFHELCIRHGHLSYCSGFIAVRLAQGHAVRPLYSIKHHYCPQVVIYYRCLAIISGKELA